MVVVVIIVVVVVYAVVIVIAVVDPRNLPLKFGLKQVINRWDVVDVSVVSVSSFISLICQDIIYFLCCLGQSPENYTMAFIGENV